MYQEYFIQKGVLLLPIVAMLAFVVTFVTVVMATYRSQKRAEFDHMSQLPLGEDGERQIDSQLVSPSSKSVQGV
ncbi:MAG: CcoQ/FixQ family Cbb3-type cytochrome c oxidase assembly chaperone [Myxococcales bacterium]|nr:CcoQ/FixQ family Cbb3-type cytochrome c oxidase assembly chaperone [Myxococcales bacterium]